MKQQLENDEKRLLQSESKLRQAMDAMQEVRSRTLYSMIASAVRLSDGYFQVLSAMQCSVLVSHCNCTVRLHIMFVCHSACSREGNGRFVAGGITMRGKGSARQV